MKVDKWIKLLQVVGSRDIEFEKSSGDLDLADLVYFRAALDALITRAMCRDILNESLN